MHYETRNDSNKIQFYFPCYNMINSFVFSLNVHQCSHSNITIFTLYEQHSGKREEQKQNPTTNSFRSIHT